MSRGLKITLVVVAIALFLCCVAGLGVTLLGTRLAGRAFITNPDRVAQVGADIAGYDVPPGYEEMFAMNLAGVKMVAIGPTDLTADFMVILLMQFSAGMEISRQEMERQMERAMAQQIGLGGADLEVVGRAQAFIKGESVTMTVREGVADDGDRLRQVTGLFQGRGGTAMLTVMGKETAWDQPLLDRFLASIR